jgi:hypothetical protein
VGRRQLAVSLSIVHFAGPASPIGSAPSPHGRPVLSGGSEFLWLRFRPEDQKIPKAE